MEAEFTYYEDFFHVVVDTYREIVKLEKELVNLPEYILESKLKTLEYSLYVFEQNYLQLRKLLDIYKDKKKALTLWDVNNRHVQDVFHLEITRLFHNFVASVKSLIDHTRIIYRDLYGKKDKFPEYQQEIDKRFAKNPFAQFVEDLRDYCLHYTSLPVFSEIQYEKTPSKFEITIRVSIETLNKYSSWSSLGKEYLRNQTEDIDITDLVRQYHDLVVSFHNWMHSCQMQIHREEFARLDEKKRILAELVIPDEVKFALADMGTNTMNPDKAFYRLLHPQQREELNKIPLNSTEHVEKLFSFIEQQAPISEELKNKIRSIYDNFIP